MVDEKNLQSKTTYLQIAVISLKTIIENWDRRDNESSTKREGDCFSAIIAIIIKLKKTFGHSHLPVIFILLCPHML